MKFNLVRFVGFLVLPIIVIGLFASGVFILKNYETKGDFIIPQYPLAREASRFTYQLVDPSTKEPLRNASVQLEIKKTEQINPWLDVGYLRQDNQGKGLVYKMDYLLPDGKINLESNFWDAGKYSVSIQATTPEQQKPINVKIPVDVKVPPGKILRTALLFAAILFAAIISGFIAGSLENPFKKSGSPLSRPVKSIISVLIVGLTFFSINNVSQGAAMNNKQSEPMGTIKVEKDGVRSELKMNPAKPVQKGTPVNFTLTFTDTKTGKPIKGMDANVFLYHADDNLTMFNTRTQIQNGQLQFNYAFPDTAEYKVIVDAAPNSPKSTLSGPINGEFSFEVPPVFPSRDAQIRGGILMLIVATIGFVIGFIGTRRKHSISFA